MLYIGIDPGEQWCGFAAFEITSDNVVRVEARTYSIGLRKGWLRMARDIVALLPHSRRAIIVIEDFQIRKAGHQRFNRGETLRFIGALQYGLGSVDSFTVYFESPRDPRIKETQMMFGRALQRYRRKWPRRHDKAWNHCMSAWRVLGSYLLRTQPDILQQIHGLKSVHPCHQWLPSASYHPKKEHIAPAAIWK